MINTCKTDNLWCNFSGDENNEGVELCIDEKVLQQKERFKYIPT